MERKDSKTPAPSNVVDFDLVRRDLRIPTLFATFIARRAGARITAASPGLVQAVITESPTPMGIRIRVRRKNIYRAEAEAYRIAGLPVPERVLEDIAHWDRTYGGRR